MVVLRLLFFIYQVLYLIALVVLLPYEVLKRPSGQRKRWLRERTGFIGPVEGQRQRLWVHAVSVGEALAARTIIEEFMERYDVFVSTVTDTGQEVARRFLPEKNILYAPFDLGPFLRRYLKRLNPRMVVVMETELWPGLYMGCHKMGIPLVLVNGRVSERSFKNYRRIRFFLKRLLALGSLYCVQTRQDADRLIAIGAPEEKVVVTGNIKLDITPPEAPPEWSSRLGHPLIIAGSTHEGEEILILEAFKDLKAGFPTLTLVIAPRHPERFSKVEALLKGLNYGRRSLMDIEGRDVVLLDSIGELTALYGAGDLCIVGGSFVPVGGHNLFEVACWGRPIITGPHMENFPLAERFFEASAAVRCSREDLYGVLKRLLEDRTYAEQMGRRAKEVFQRFQGAKKRTLDFIERLL